MNNQKPINRLKIGISISDNPANERLNNDKLKVLSKDLVKLFFSQSATIIYGGGIKKDEFTQFILDEAQAFKSKLNNDNVCVENHLAWPLYLSNTELTAWLKKYQAVLKTVKHDIPKDAAKNVDKDVFLAPDSIDNKYIWARSLTTMRELSIERSHARVCAGGKLTGYLGIMPGILEEVVIAIEKNKPLFLLGGFGGVVDEICKTITNKQISPPITEQWQIANNEGYSELQEKAKLKNMNADYAKIKTILESTSIDNLAKSSGLSKEDYRLLMQSNCTNECISLIDKAINNLTQKEKQ